MCHIVSRMEELFVTWWLEIQPMYSRTWVTQYLYHKIRPSNWIETNRNDMNQKLIEKRKKINSNSSIQSIHVNLFASINKIFKMNVSKRDERKEWKKTGIEYLLLYWVDGRRDQWWQSTVYVCMCVSLSLSSLLSYYEYIYEWPPCLLHVL